MTHLVLPCASLNSNTDLEMGGDRCEVAGYLLLWGLRELTDAELAYVRIGLHWRLTSSYARFGIL